MTKYNVILDVFFTDSVSIEADNEEEAKKLAIDSINYGMGEEVTVYEIEEDE